MTTTTELYLKREEITNVQQTIEDLLTKLATSEKAQTEHHTCQIVLQLNREKESGKKWLMFVYYNVENDTFNFSFQDEDYYDTDLTCYVTREYILARMLEEIREVEDFEWIALDY